MSNYLNTLQEAVDILSNGTHSWMERLFSKGPTAELKNLSSMNVWNGWMTWQADYRPADTCLLYTSPSPRDGLLSRMPSSA